MAPSRSLTGTDLWNYRLSLHSFVSKTSKNSEVEVWQHAGDIYTWLVSLPHPSVPWKGLLWTSDSASSVFSFSLCKSVIILTFASPFLRRPLALFNAEGIAPFESILVKGFLFFWPWPDPLDPGLVGSWGVDESRGSFIADVPGRRESPRNEKIN